MSFPESILLRHGSPKGIIFERGAHFITRFMEEVMRLSHMSHRKNPTYHPQTKGLREHVNKDLADMLSVYVDVEHNTWDTITPHVTLAKSAVIEEKTDPTSFRLVPVRESPTMLDAIVSRHLRDDNNDDDTAAIFQRPKEVRHSARPRMNKQTKHLRQPVRPRTPERRLPPWLLVWVCTSNCSRELREKFLKLYFGP